ncbi:thymidylate kinase [Xylona heveae TC161]|uniref:Thymidylate kinase n=1 Tax=Xylona heveae (strain CBS 132557 / TC161) TaxID=1328760 RepID=A0A165ADX8_XYLHT|nr:thymidylate kinase [Xylona heveae TC161]KZF20318.1 thymidylate kinase [Xylona heveae TC161]
MTTTEETTGRGMLIVVEGLDRAGKTTQCQRLVENLSNDGHRVEFMRFPNRTTPIGQMIDGYLKANSEVPMEDHVIHLLFSANRWEASENIQRLIATGTTVVIDRYYYSGCVYSAAKDNPKLNLAWARQPDVGLPRPDVCVFLDLSSEAAAERGGFGQERYETTRMQQRVRELFQEMAKSPDADDFVIIDAGDAVEKVEKKIIDAVSGRRQLSNLRAPLREVLPWS